MLKFFVKRMLGAIPLMLIIIALAFFMMRIAPGGPFDAERTLPPEIEKNVLAAYDLDKPLVQQFGIYVYKILHGDFGPSLKIHDFTVAELIAKGAPASIQLGLSAITLALLIGVPLGTLAAIKQNSRWDFGIMAGAMAGIVVPSFVMAPLLSLVIGVYWEILPTSGWGDGELKYRVLPTIALALPQVAYLARLTRGSMLEVLNSNFVRTARAKGLREWLVVVRHALKAGLLPVVSYLGPATAAVTTGSVVVETIFAIPGIGTYFVKGALNRDYTLVMGVVIVYATIIITLNLVVDMLYGLLDPKLQANR